MRTALMFSALLVFVVPVQAQPSDPDPVRLRSFRLLRNRLFDGPALAVSAQKDPADPRFIAVGKPVSGKYYMRHDSTKITPYGTVDPSEGVICSILDPGDPALTYFGKPTVSGTSWSAVFDQGEGGVPTGGVPYRDAAWTFRLESPIGMPMVGMDTLDVPFYLRADGADGELKSSHKKEVLVKKKRSSLAIKKHLLDMVWPKATGVEPPTYTAADREIIARGVIFRPNQLVRGTVFKEPLGNQLPVDGVEYQNGTDWTIRFSLRSLPPGNYRVVVRTDELLDHILVVLR